MRDRVLARGPYRRSVLRRVPAWFPVWALAGSTWAYLRPDLFLPLKSAIVPLLGVIMFGMGITLRMADFAEVVRRPALVAIGVTLQFVLMPFFAWVVAHTLQLPTDLLVGLVLVGCCPGGTASNVISYLAKADVPLSIILTASTTLLAFAVTPGLTLLYLGRTVPVPAMAMMVDILRIIVLPVAAGVVVNTLWGRGLRRLTPWAPVGSMAAIVLVIAIIVGMNQPSLARAGMMVFLSVVLLNGLGYAWGYLLATLFGFGEPQARTTAIEVGMQNSGLGVALSVAYFSPMAALPSALFSIWQNLSGAALATYWSRRSAQAR